MILQGWGNYPSVQTAGFFFETESQLNRLLKEHNDIIIHGQGRSYGDSALNETVVFSKRFDNIVNFDAEKGIVICESGVTLSDLIEAYLPKGWFLSVTPGTKFISVGGAIASDVHGKNHHTAGCFSESVISFELMLSDGSVKHCSKEDNPDLFHATCGGMGLTGVILTATIQLQPVQSSLINETIIRCRNLEEAFSFFEQYSDLTYSVAWIDCLATGKDMGRSVLMVGEHAETGNLEAVSTRPSFAIPFNLPGFCLNKYSVSAFNGLYYWKQKSSDGSRAVSLDTFFYPLDTIGRWNRMYGAKGFTQYQCVLPKSDSYNGLKMILKKIALSGQGSFLAVLKLFGPQNDNYLSFPMEGYTLALDFKIQRHLFPLLDELDKIVIDCGGRLYLAKDARMKKDIFVKGYPDLNKLVELREKSGMNKKFNSLQSRRLEI